MTCRDLLEAEIVLFGEGTSRSLTVRRWPGGADRLNDLAQAWIDGDRERVLAYVQDHADKLRMRSESVNAGPMSRVDQIRELRKQGWSTKDIARELKISRTWVNVACRGLPRLPRGRRKVDPERIRSLRDSGLTWTAIATSLGLSVRTVARVLSETSSAASATN